MKKFSLIPLLTLVFSLSLVFPVFAVSDDNLNTNLSSWTSTSTTRFKNVTVRFYSSDGQFLEALPLSDTSLTFSSFLYPTSTLNSNGSGSLIGEFYLSSTFRVYGESFNIILSQSSISNVVSKDGNTTTYYGFSVPSSTYSESTANGNYSISKWYSFSGGYYCKFTFPIKNLKYSEFLSDSNFSFYDSTSLYSGWYAFMLQYMVSSINPSSEPVSYKFEPTTLNLYLDVDYNYYIRLYDLNQTKEEVLFRHQLLHGTDLQQAQVEQSRQNVDNAIGRLTDASDSLDSYVPANINSSDYTFSAITDGLNVNSSLSIFTNILNQPFVLQICLIVFSLMLIGFIFFGER